MQNNNNVAVNVALNGEASSSQVEGPSLVLKYDRIMHTAKFMAPKRGHKLLQNIYLKEGTTHAVATDGCRMHIDFKATASPTYIAPSSVLVPSTLLNTVSKTVSALRMKPDTLTIKKTGEEGSLLTIEVTNNTYSLTFTGIAGGGGIYPNYEGVIPSNIQTYFDFNASDMLEALHKVKPYVGVYKRVALMPSHSYGSIEAIIDEGKEAPPSIALPSPSEAKELAPAYYNADYLTDILKVMGGKVFWGYTSASSESVFLSSDKSKAHVLMPMKAP